MNDNDILHNAFSSEINNDDEREAQQAREETMNACSVCMQRKRMMN